MELQQNQKINLALIIPSLCYGGAERQVVEIARYINRYDDFDAKIITLSDFTPLLPVDDELRQKLHVIKKNSKYDVFVIWRLVRLLNKLNIHVVHAFLFNTEIASRLIKHLSKVKVVIGSERNADYKISKPRWFVLKLTSYFLDAVVSNSSSGAAYHQKLYGLSQDKYSVVYNGVDTERFRVRNKQECRAALDIDNSVFLIGMFASFKSQKNHLALFEAILALQNTGRPIKLLLAGDTLLSDFGATLGYKKEVLDRLVDTGLDQNTLIVGNRKDVENLYPACDICVLPSLHEGTPNVVLESMACGIPNVITDVSDNSILVKNGEEGFVVPPGDVDALRDAIERLIADDELRNRMGKNARDAATERYSLSRMVCDMSSVYRETLQKHV